MEGADGGGGDNAGVMRPPPPVLLLDGQDLGDEYERGDIVDLTSRLEELVTTEQVHGRENFSESDDNFERVIGAIEEIVVGDEFQALQNFFLSTYWTKFTEQNSQDFRLGETDETNAHFGEKDERHEHFKIFKTYSQEMAQLLESQLKKVFRDEHFEFNQFVEEFGRRVETMESGGDSNPLLESEIFEMLFTLIDFVKFKELFTDYKEMMEGKTPNLATGITLKSVPPTPRNRSEDDLE